MHEPSKEKISYLHLSVSLCNDNLYTNLHIKATDCHQHLEYMSSHPEHTKKSIIYSQTLCLRRLCSVQQDFEGHKINLRSWFVKRRYPEEIIEGQMWKVKFNFSMEINFKEKEGKGVPLVVAYHPRLNCLNKIIRENLPLLYTNNKVKKVTKKHCEVCKNVNITDSFTSSVTQNTCKISLKLKCDDKRLIYLLIWKQCLKQYAGETADVFHKRWNNYKNNASKFLREELYATTFF